jgi:hypothetical protein
MVAASIAAYACAAGSERYCRWGRGLGVGALAERRIFGGTHVGPRVIGGLHMRRDNAERAGIENTLHIARARHAHERRNADLKCGHADLARCLQGKTRMLHVDIEAVEACGLGDARDLDAAHQPHRHRGDDLAPGKLVLGVIAHNGSLVCHRHSLPISCSSTSRLTVPARGDSLNAKRETPP